MNAVLDRDMPTVYHRKVSVGTVSMVLPDPEKLRQVLAVARECGVSKLRCGGLDVTFAGPAEVEPLTPFVDADGKPVDLDEGLPDLAQPPEFDREVDPVVRANFAPHDKAKAS